MAAPSAITMLPYLGTDYIGVNIPSAVHYGPYLFDLYLTIRLFRYFGHLAYNTGEAFGYSNLTAFVLFPVFPSAYFFELVDKQVVSPSRRQGAGV